jgi:hypothetical protein
LSGISDESNVRENIDKQKQKLLFKRMMEDEKKRERIMKEKRRKQLRIDAKKYDMMSKKINSRLKKAVPLSPTKLKSGEVDPNFIKVNKRGGKTKEDLLGLSAWKAEHDSADIGLHISGTNPQSPRFEIDFNTGQVNLTKTFKTPTQSSKKRERAYLSNIGESMSNSKQAKMLSKNMRKIESNFSKVSQMNNKKENVHQRLFSDHIVKEVILNEKKNLLEKFEETRWTMDLLDQGVLLCKKFFTWIKF